MVPERAKQKSHEQGPIMLVVGGRGKRRRKTPQDAPTKLQVPPDRPRPLAAHLLAGLVWLAGLSWGQAEPAAGSQLQVFGGLAGPNDSFSALLEQNNFKLLERDGDSLLVGAR